MSEPSRGSPQPAPALGYYWGDDDYALEHAADRIAAGLAATSGVPTERWRIRGDARGAVDAAERIARIGERVATSPFFGGGTLAVVAQPGGLVRSKEERARLASVIGLVAPGNGLAFVETLDPAGRRPASLAALSEVVAAAGGEVREIRAPKEAQMVRWIHDRATERSIRLGRGSAQELATRLGAFVREGDVDRRRMGWLAVSELEKLALYRPASEVTVDDVRALVPEVVPGSVWALLDAIALRQPATATSLVERLVDATPAPVMLAVIHRRIRELLQVADLVAEGARPPEIIRTLGLKPYPAEKLVQATTHWTAAELEHALEGLLELDVAIKGSDGQVVSEAQVRLALSIWIADHVTRRAAIR